eukprot:TRINITY_DN10662_c0_g1_i1.p1 TRINITY_DN10662_c0_g1~~TRINITY_DN10662_c0_g1_i1.p1  ORF type:complete len:362 (+),score=86.96 TRINITY_DN10662_c0_g1_i1:209-1294(+)
MASFESNNFVPLTKMLMEIFAPSLSIRSNVPFRLLVVGNDLSLSLSLKSELNGMSNKKRSTELTLLMSRMNFQEKVSGIEILEGTLASFQSERLFDAIVYMGSLRVAHPLSEIIIRSRMLLKEEGMFISEEYTRKMNDKETFRWFFDSLDLIESVGTFHWPKSVHADEHPMPNVVSPVKKGHRKNLSVTGLSGIFSRHRKSPSTVTEGDINIEDLKNLKDSTNSSNSSVNSSPSSGSMVGSPPKSPLSNSSTLNDQNISPMCSAQCEGLDILQRWERFHEGDKFMNVAKEDAIINHLNAVFGEENVIIKKDLPFFYHFLSNGLTRESKSLTVLQSFLEKEQQRIRDKVIKPIGMLIISQNR